MLKQQNICDQPEPPAKDIAFALIRLAVLCALGVWVFRLEILDIVVKIPNSSETAHALVAPAAVLLLLYCRRKLLKTCITKGSSWGIVLLVGGIILYAGAAWPFSFGYIRCLALIPVLAGAVWVACGARFLKLISPMLLLLLLAIPIGARLNAGLIIYPETYTISATARLLDMLPGIDTTVKGVDLFFTSARKAGIVALGESNRAARLFLAFAAIGVFVTFSHIRSPLRILMAALAAGPIVLFCNFLRFFCWSLLAVYGSVSPTGAWPRNISAVCSLTAAYLLFVLICAAKLNLFVEVEQIQENNSFTNNNHETG